MGCKGSLWPAQFEEPLSSRKEIDQLRNTPEYGRKVNMSIKSAAKDATCSMFRDPLVTKLFNIVVEHSNAQLGEVIMLETCRRIKVSRQGEPASRTWNLKDSTEICRVTKGMSHSQFLATGNFTTDHDIVPWIGEKLHIGAEFKEFSRNKNYVRVPGKLSEQPSKVPMLSNLGDKVLKCVKTRGKICPII